MPTDGVENNEHSQDYVEKKNSPEKKSESIGNFEKKIENTLNTIQNSLQKTTLMLLKLGIGHPEINNEIHELNQKVDKNKDKMTREFTSDVLRQIEDLLSKYGDDKEKDISNKLRELLGDIQAQRIERNKVKFLKAYVDFFDNHFGKDVATLTRDVDTIKGENNTPNTRTSIDPFIIRSDN